MVVWRRSGGGEGGVVGEWDEEGNSEGVVSVDEIRHVDVTEELGGTSMSVR
jgi:hypothetical protein